MRILKAHIQDDNGILWTYDSVKETLECEGDDSGQGGYHSVSNFDSALRALIEGGYIGFEGLVLIEEGEK